MTLGESGLVADVSAPLEVVRVGADDPPLFQAVVHLITQEVPANARLVMERGLLAVHPVETGSGTLELSYRRPVVEAGQRLTVRVPLLASASGQVVLRAMRPDLEFEGGILWNQSTAGDVTTYELSVTGSETLLLGWPVAIPEAAAPVRTEKAAEAGKLYGIRITESTQLTVIGSDGSATHFARFRLPPFHPPQFAFDLPAGANVISATVDGFELSEPEVQGARCVIPLDAGGASASHDVAVRIQLAEVRLGFIGQAALSAPTAEATIGTLRWTIALPSQFRARVISSSLDPTSAQPDLVAFGDYGAVANQATLVSLAKTLVPPRPIEARLRCHQVVPGFPSW
jgi:hypothetical protein